MTFLIKVPDLRSKEIILPTPRLIRMRKGRRVKGKRQRRIKNVSFVPAPNIVLVSVTNIKMLSLAPKDLMIWAGVPNALALHMRVSVEPLAVTIAKVNIIPGFMLDVLAPLVTRPRYY